MRRRLTFRERDVRAVIKAMRGCGLQIARAEVCEDRAVIIPGEPAPNCNPIPETADPDTDPETLAIREAFRNAKA